MRVLLRPYADPGWIQKIARMIWILELTGVTHFGGPDVFAWYLTDRARKGDSHLRITSYVSRRWDERPRTDAKTKRQ